MFEWLLPNVTEGVDPALYFFCVGAAVLITGISKAGFGGGVGILAMPVMAQVMEPGHMLGVMLPVLIACDIFSNLHHIGHYDAWRRLRPLLLGLVTGIGIGTVILIGFRNLDLSTFNQVMAGVIGTICLIVVLMQAYRLTGREIPTLPPHPVSSVTVGAVAGAVSTLNHAAGPIVQIYLMQRVEDKLAKRKLVGTLLIYFLIGNTLKLPTYSLLPMNSGRPFINADTLRDSIWFIPLIPLGTMLGAWMHHRVPEKPFAAIMYTAAGITAAMMVYKAVF